MSLGARVLNRLVWFYVGFVLVNFAALLWIFMSSYLTVYAGLPLPYFMLYTPGNVAAADLVVLALVLVLYVYLGVVLVLSGLGRGYVPIMFALTVIAGAALLLANLLTALIIDLIIALALLIGNYGVLMSIAVHRASRYMWLVGALLIIATVTLAIIGKPISDYAETTAQSLSILACAIEAWVITGRQGKPVA